MNGQQNRLLLGVLVAVAAMGLLMGVVAWSLEGNGWMLGWGGMMAFGWLWMLLPIALMVAIMYGMMSMGHGHHGAAHAQGRPDDARAILDRRYAAGEISRDDYARIRDDLDPPRRP